MSRPAVPSPETTPSWASGVRRRLPFYLLALALTGVGASVLGPWMPSTWRMPVAILALVEFAALLTFRRARTWSTLLLLAFAITVGALLSLVDGGPLLDVLPRRPHKRSTAARSQGTSDCPCIIITGDVAACYNARERGPHGDRFEPFQYRLVRRFWPCERYKQLVSNVCRCRGILDGLERWFRSR